MKCAFDYCIYNKNFMCVLDEVEIDNAGMCETCIIVSLDTEFLESEKERQLRETDSR